MNRIVFVLVILMAGMATESKAQVFKTKLQVVVRNDLGNTVEGATVTLYKTEADYDEEKNPVQTAQTTAKGKVLFMGLEPISYYMNVEKDDLNNVGRGAKTTKLIDKKKNIVDVIIE